jgi:protocatechuate 3,4-dioxygenase beta subunit
MKRRVLLQVAAAAPLLAGVACQATARGATESQQTGPYYPLEPIPLHSDLILGDSFAGDELLLSGRVLTLNAEPIDYARVEIWQCDARGIYPHPSAPNHETFDPAFAGQGAVMTDGEGRYAFRTIMPVPYTGRPPHIHVRLKREQRILLTTQLYLRGSGGRESLKIDAASAGDQGFEANFDFTVKA